MDIVQAMENRASVRKFTNDPVPLEHLQEMVRLAGLAPSVNNSQPWKFIVVTDKERLQCMSGAVREKLGTMLPADASDEQKKAFQKVDWFSTFFVDAPAVIAVASSPYEAVVDQMLQGTTVGHEDLNDMRGRPDVQSIGAAIQNLLLAAYSLGYGTCWLSGPVIARESLEKCLEIDQPWRLAAMVAVGKAAVPTKQKEKKSLDQILEIR